MCQADLYTKTMLTVIACALVALITQNVVASSRAAPQDQVQKVAICNLGNDSCATVVAVNNSLGSNYTTLLTQVAPQPLPVCIVHPANQIGQPNPLCP